MTEKKANETFIATASKKGETTKQDDVHREIKKISSLPEQGTVKKAGAVHQPTTQTGAPANKAKRLGTIVPRDQAMARAGRIPQGATVTPKAKVEAEKPAEVKVEAPKTEAPKVETPKQEAPKAEAVKEAPKTEPAKVETPKTEAPKQEAPKAEAPKQEVAKEAPKAAAPKQAPAKETPKQDGKPAQRENQGERKPYNRDGQGQGERRPYNKEGQGERRPYNRDGQNQGERRPYNRDGQGQGERRPYNRDGQGQGERRPYNRDGQGQGERRPYNRDGQGQGERRPYNRDGQGQGERRPYNRDGQNQGYQKRDNQGGYNNFAKDKDDQPQRRPSQPRKDSRPSGGMDGMSVKHTQKDAQKRNFVEKEHDKFGKFEGGQTHGGKKSKQAMEYRSLEKAAKPKKHSQYKTQVEEEEDDILEDMPTGTIALSCPITVGGFCEQTEVSMNSVIMTLMKMGIMANINQNLDQETVELLAADLGISVVVAKAEEKEVEEGIEDFEDREEDLKPRAPFVTVMGHVDHGKTSLLDAIRNTNVVSGESGGITQHIGASEVTVNGQKIVFLDTPGHEAFTAMRARGAHVTDIAVLVVAADDGVMPQTIESISHAKAAGVPIIVAINKMDKPAANPDRVKQELTEHGILVEDWGGDTISVPVSAKKGTGIQELLEMILLQAEVLELKANPNRMAKGSVIEARLDKTKGPVATLLVDNGTLRPGQSVVVGNCYGKIRLMTDFRGKTIAKAGPATAVEILGLDDVPVAGDEFNAVKDDKTAREIAENRRQKIREEVLARNASSTLEKLFSQIQDGEVKDLNLIVKADVQGSVEAIVASLEKLNNDNVRVKIVHTGVGTINESDIMLASTTGSIVIGFNVRPTTAVQTYADRENVQIRLYRVIYDIINEIEDAMKGMLDPEFKEEVLGKIEVRETFRVPNVGTIAGAYVMEGKAVRNAEVRLVRDGIVIHEGKISSLKRFKDDAKEVNSGYECGIGIENYNDIKIGDVIECFHMVEVERK